MSQKFNDVAQELNLLGDAQQHQQDLHTMYQSFIESPLADCRERRTRITQLFKQLQQLF